MLLATSENERTTSKEERVQQKAVFYYFCFSFFLQKSSKLIIWTLRIFYSKIPHTLFPKGQGYEH
jgi:hypothetical protein